MRSTAQIAPPRTKLSTLPFEQRRGVQAGWLLAATESMLFICFFGAYYYLGNNENRWAQHQAPDLWVPFTNLGIVLAGGVALWLGGRALKSGNQLPARLAIWFTALCGIFFLCLEGYEYTFSWMVEAPYNDAYGSIFYTINFMDDAHVVAGVLILAFVGSLPQIGATEKTPHFAFQTVAWYWYFVIGLWFIIVMLLYVVPVLQRLHS